MCISLALKSQCFRVSHGHVSHVSHAAGETWASDQCMACDGLTTFLWWNLGRAELGRAEGRAEVLAGNMEFL